MHDGEGLDCYDVELDRLENELVESAEDGVPDGLDELGEGDLLDLKPIVKERRNGGPPRPSALRADFASVLRASASLLSSRR
jgi:hypothetical protein